VGEKRSHALCRFRSRHPVQVESRADRVVSAAQLPELAAIDAVGGVVVRQFASRRNTRVGLPHHGGSRDTFDPPARIRWQPHDIGHRALEFIVVIVRPSTLSHEPW
jgi:hypothetical protein